MSKIKLNLTLCYQFDSKYYSKLDLLECISRAIEIANKEIGDYEIKFEEIEEGNLSSNIHENIHKSLVASHIIIFEISDLNKNVLYELGLAKGLGKKCLLIKERQATDKLPFDISPYQCVTYSSKELINFKNLIAGKIKREVFKLQPEDIFSNDSIEKFLSKYLAPIRSTVDMRNKFDDLVNKTQMNFYYLGTIGLLTLSDEEDWITTLSSKALKPKIYRIVFLRNLSEIYNIYKNGTILINYCVWLSKYYLHIKNKRLELFNCPDIGIWKAGMSVIISDEKETLILTGTFGEFNSKGIWINHNEIGGIFKEYSKILAIGNSERVDYIDMIKYFDLGSKDRAKELLKTLPEYMDDEKIYEQCKQYVEDSFDV